MVYKANVLPIMIASPSDVAEQRDGVRSIIENWNFINGYSEKIILMPVGWETHSAPDLAGKAQGIINDRLLADCDLLVGIFWTRLGTATESFESGTVEEISRHTGAGKPAMIYFSDVPVPPRELDTVEYARLQSFRAWCYNQGLVESFSSHAGFCTKFANHLQIQLNSHPYLKGILKNATEADLLAPDFTEMSPDSEVLLLAAADAVDGQVLALSTYGGRHIQIKGQTFGEPSDARSVARWESALNELVDLGYFTPRGAKGQVYQITNAGYLRADQLKNIGLL